jgi:hypothetical protein
MNRADTLGGAVASQQNPMTEVIAGSLEQRCEAITTSAARPIPRMISAAVNRRLASPVRLTLASRLGNEIDGAWWPRTELISQELPELVSDLDVRLGQVIDINVNWVIAAMPAGSELARLAGSTPTHNDGWRAQCPR